MYRYNLLGSIIKYTMGSIVFINGITFYADMQELQVQQI